MPASGTDLGADLHYLYVAAKHNLPDVAGVFAQAAQALGPAGDGDEYWTFPAVFSGKMSHIRQSWLDLRGSIKGYLDDTAGNLADTAHALILAVDAYAANDSAAAAEMNRLNAQNGPY